MSQREVKSMVSARQDGWSGTTHIAVFSSYILTWSEQICHPSDDESLYNETNDWNWDSDFRTLANGLLNILLVFNIRLCSCLQSNC